MYKYTFALKELDFDKKTKEKMLNDFSNFLTIFYKNYSFINFFNDPFYSLEQKEKILRKLLPKINIYTLNLIKIWIKDQTFRLFFNYILEIVSLFLNDLNKDFIMVESFPLLKPKQITTLKKKIAKHLKFKDDYLVNLENKSLLGGFIVRINNSNEIDLSFSTKIKKLSEYGK